MTVRVMTLGDVAGAVALQRECFPPPFPQEFHWKSRHLEEHIRLYPEGQFVAVEGEKVIGAASNCLISEEQWQAHLPWYEAVGGPMIKRHDPRGTTMYGLDISVHPAYRRLGVGRALYHARFDLVRSSGLKRYGTGCRMPGFLAWSRAHSGASVEIYARAVVAGEATDRTLTALLRYGLTFLGVIHDYMEDEESANAGALLEWQP